MPLVVLQHIFRLVGRINSREPLTVIEVDMTNGGNNQASRLRTDNRLRTVVAQTFRSIIHSEFSLNIFRFCMHSTQKKHHSHQERKPQFHILGK